MSSDEMKSAAARAALSHLPSGSASGSATGSGGCVVGLGTGSTTRFFIEAVGELVRGGRSFSCVPTSRASRALAERCGIPLLDDAGPWQLELCVDGADEVSPSLDLIKGGGGAHTREKIVNQAAKKNVIIVDESKLVARLGETRPVPLEVLPFGLNTTLVALGALGQPRVRLVEGAPLMSDSGNFIVDLTTAPIDDPAKLDRTLRGLPGIVETGLFIGRADVVVVAGAQGIRELRRQL